MLRSIGKQSVESLTHWTEFGFVVNWIITSWAVIARICCRRVSVSICLSVCLSQIGRISGVSNGWVRCAVACEHILSISMSFPTTVERLSSYTTDKTKQYYCRLRETLSPVHLCMPLLIHFVHTPFSPGGVVVRALDLPLWMSPVRLLALRFQVTTLGKIVLVLWYYMFFSVVPKIYRYFNVLR